MNIISFKLKDLRLRNGFTQQQLADYLQIDRSTYTKYETSHTPSVEILCKLAAFYSVKLDDIVGTDYGGPEVILSNKSKIEDIGMLSDDEIRLVKIFRSCDRKSEFITKAKILAVNLNIDDDLTEFDE